MQMTPEKREDEKMLFAKHLVNTGWCEGVDDVVWDRQDVPHVPGCNMRFEWYAWLARAEIAVGEGRSTVTLDDAQRALRAVCGSRYSGYDMARLVSAMEWLSAERASSKGTPHAR